jgi:hypothetical protein
VLVASCIIVAGIGADWALTSHHSARSPSFTTQVGSTYGSVASNLTRWAATYSGGGWSLLGAQGYAIPPNLVPGPVNSTAFIDISGGGSCSYTSLVSSSETFDIPATQGNLSAGNASYWRIDMTGSQGRVLTVIELGGAFYPLAAGTCSTNTSEVFATTTPAVVDSPVAALVAWGAGGSGYASNHTTFTVEYAVSSGLDVFGNYSPPQWLVQFVDCSQGATFSPTPAFDATVNGTTGALLGSSWARTGGCPPTS